MGGLVGIVGEGSFLELTRMAERMSYRGRLRSWSPAAGVLLGELSSHASMERRNSDSFAIDTAGDGTSRLNIETALTTRGVSAAADLRGFFSIAWWDSRSRSLRFICDRHGYKTLYIARLPGRIVFATDCKALLALAEFPATVDRDVLQVYLRSRSFPSERSLLAAAQPIGGANVWTLTFDGALHSEPYWTPEQRGVGKTRTFEAAASELREILKSVVTRRLDGRDHMALALSGGLDSASVLAVAKHVRPDIHVTTYTVGHSPQDPEILRAREAAEHFHTEHRECFLPPEKLPGELRKLVWLTEDLTGREEAALQQVLAAEMATRERSYFVGHGADVAFAGMPRHRLMWLRDHAPSAVRGALDELFVYTQRRNEPSSWLGRALASLAFRGDRPAMPTVIGAAEMPADMSYQSLEHYRCATVSWIEGMRFHEPEETAGDVAMVVPFFDPAVVDFALSCPSSYLIDARNQKRILRAAVAPLLPPQISQRPKMIQRMKHDQSLSDVLDDFAGQLRLKESLMSRGLIPAEYIAKLQKRSRSAAYSSERLHILWALICAELWLRQFVDQRGVLDATRASIARTPIIVPASVSANHPAPIP